MRIWEEYGLEDEDEWQKLVNESRLFKVSSAAAAATDDILSVTEHAEQFTKEYCQAIILQKSTPLTEIIEAATSCY